MKTTNLFKKILAQMRCFSMPRTNVLILVLCSPMVENKSSYIIHAYRFNMHNDDFSIHLFYCCLGFEVFFFSNATSRRQYTVWFHIHIYKFKQMCTYIKHLHLYIDIIQQENVRQNVLYSFNWSIQNVRNISYK